MCKVSLKSVRDEDLVNQSIKIQLEQNNQVFYSNDFVSDSKGNVAFELDCSESDRVNSCSFNSSTRNYYTKTPGIVNMKVDIWNY